MAADIKNYLKEKEKRQKSQDDYKKKIRKHRLKIVYRVLLVVAALGAALALVVVQAKRHIYTGYDTVSSISREVSSDATDIRLKNSILTYSKDGAHCTDAKGNVKWNQTYVIQDVKIATCGDVAAIGSYNGREIYVQNTDKQLGNYYNDHADPKYHSSGNGKSDSGAGRYGCSLDHDLRSGRDQQLYGTGTYDGRRVSGIHQPFTGRRASGDQLPVCGCRRGKK